MKIIHPLLLLLVAGVVLPGCKGTGSSTAPSAETPGAGPVTAETGAAPDGQGQKVVLYCSVDEVFARPIIAQIEKDTGLDVVPLFDAESAKTAGLANKIRAERARPRADVFWSSALLQTQLLAEEGLLEAHEVKSAADLPPEYRDPTSKWTGVGVRPRILVSNQPPGPTGNGNPWSLTVLPNVKKGQLLGVSNPMFGTASDWICDYAARWGQAKAARYLADLKTANVRMLPGNGDVAKAVAAGQLQFGITDSDDFLNLKKRGEKLYLVPTTQDNVLVPGTVAKVAGAPHPEAAARLMEAIASASTEKQLVQTMPGVFPIRGNDPAKWRSEGVDFSIVARGGSAAFTKWPEAWKDLNRPLAQFIAP